MTSQHLSSGDLLVIRKEWFGSKFTITHVGTVVRNMILSSEGRLMTTQQLGQGHLYANRSPAVVMY